MSSASISRRGFLQATAWVTVGSHAVGVTFLETNYRPTLAIVGDV